MTRVTAIEIAGSILVFIRSITTNRNSPREQGNSGLRQGASLENLGENHSYFSLAHDFLGGHRPCFQFAIVIRLQLRLLSKRLQDRGVGIRVRAFGIGARLS